MEINVWVVLLLLFLHWIADFVLQTEWMAVNKYKDKEALLTHVLVYTSVFFIFSFGMYLIESNIAWLLFSLVIGILHFYTDMYTSRWTNRLSRIAKITGSYHNFFVVIGFDQLLHFLQLLLVFKLFSH